MPSAPSPSSESNPEPNEDAGTFHGYPLVPVYRRVTAEQRSEAIRLWLDQGGLKELCVAERRSHGLVYLARDPDGRLAGLSSVGLGRRNADGRTVYDLHVFIAPAHRIPYLARELTRRTRDLLKADSRQHPASGMRLTADNPKLMRPGIRRYLERHGFQPRGTDQRGVDRWFAPFD
jgi:hypothetical protein